jgi:hypothetical protein
MSVISCAPEAALARTRLSRGGDYVPPDVNVVARGLFIDAVTRLVPEALDELKALAPQLPDQNDGLVTVDRRVYDHERSLRDWCLKFGFTAVPWKRHREHTDTGTTQTVPIGRDWLLELARQTTQWVRKDDSWQIADVIKMCVTGSYAAVDGPPPPRWDIDVETEHAFIVRQNAYRVQVKQRAIAAGRVVARSLNEADTAKRNFEWLALFQVAGVEAADIRKRYKSPRPSVDTIREAIADAAREAGVHLRTARRGRPPDE